MLLLPKNTPKYIARFTEEMFLLSEVRSHDRREPQRQAGSLSLLFSYIDVYVYFLSQRKELISLILRVEILIWIIYVTRKGVTLYQGLVRFPAVGIIIVEI